MNDKAPSYVPPNAAVCWVDDRNVYVATPMGLEQYIQTFPLSEAGFAKALNLLKTRYAALPPNMVITPVRQTTRSFRVAKKWSGETSKAREPVGTEKQRSAALEILKKRGMLR